MLPLGQANNPENPLATSTEALARYCAERGLGPLEHQVLATLVEHSNAGGVVEKYSHTWLVRTMGRGPGARHCVPLLVRTLENAGVLRLSPARGGVPGWVALTDWGESVARDGRATAAGERARRPRDGRATSGARDEHASSFERTTFERGESASLSKAQKTTRYRGHELLELVALRLEGAPAEALWAFEHEGGRVRLRKALEQLETSGWDAEALADALAGPSCEWGPVPTDQAFPVGLLLWRADRLLHRRRSGPPPVPPACGPGGGVRPGGAGSDATLTDPPTDGRDLPPVAAGVVGALAERLRSMTPACSALTLGKET